MNQPFYASWHVPNGLVMQKWVLGGQPTGRTGMGDGQIVRTRPAGRVLNYGPRAGGGEAYI